MPSWVQARFIGLSLVYRLGMREPRFGFISALILADGRNIDLGTEVVNRSNRTITVFVVEAGVEVMVGPVSLMRWAALLGAVGGSPPVGPQVPALLSGAEPNEPPPPEPPEPPEPPAAPPAEPATDSLPSGPSEVGVATNEEFSSLVMLM